MKRITQVNVMWRGRKQTLKECTETFLVFLERLKLYDERFSIWYEGGFTRKQALENKIIYEYDYIKSKFCSNCKDTDYPEFDFDIGFWNGGETDATSFGIRASLGGDGSVGNSICSLTFPSEGELYEHYKIMKNWEQILELFVDHWNPDQFRDFKDNLVQL